MSTKYVWINEMIDGHEVFTSLPTFNTEPIFTAKKDVMYDLPENDTLERCTQFVHNMKEKDTEIIHLSA